MERVEAPTLEEAYEKAATQLACSITDLDYEVIQYPSKGFLGLLKKNAVIVATCKHPSAPQPKESASSPKEPAPSLSEEESVASEIISTLKEEASSQTPASREESVEAESGNDAVLESFFEVDNNETEAFEDECIVYDELALLIEEQLKELLSHSCFAIDVVEVDVRDDTALIFIDGDDAALLIGKEGYRYNALSYMLFNWLHTKYELFIKLEIAEFLTSQQEMIRNYIKPVIENVEKHGRGKTRSLDGILVQIALEQLREAFPDKYVAVKTGREGNKFVVINEFNNKNHA
jgi:spoIIIJ-associated protein